MLLFHHLGPLDDQNEKDRIEIIQVKSFFFCSMDEQMGIEGNIKMEISSLLDGWTEINVTCEM